MSEELQAGLPKLKSKLSTLITKKIANIVSDSEINGNVSYSSESMQTQTNAELESKNYSIDSLLLQTSTEKENIPLEGGVQEMLPKSFSSGISQKIIEAIVSHIPSEYSNLIANDVTGVFDSIKQGITSPEGILANITQEKINGILANLPTNYIQFAVNSLEIQNDDGQSIALNLEFQSKTFKPFLEFLVTINGITKSLGKVIFQIDFFGDIKDIILHKDDLGIILSCGVLDATFNLSVAKLEVMKNPLGNPEEGKVLIEKKFKKKLPSYQISLGDP